ncbi:protein FAR1-RELATED SEQUENCE 5-like [Silene latifolia]|uniref:protein FAR1-RELATED SEQUENCE 5-like n=1 Tax=Silene latifolia TaxID=37657 RepID=UPI003D779DC1
MPEKVGRAICNDTEFMTDINAAVWDVDLEPDKFEQIWKTVIEAHGMQSNRWLKYVYAIRQKWIPAYFRDLPLGCLLRTTQRSESSNSYFKRFESHFGTLVEFWMRYNSAIEQQRHTQRRMDNANEHSMLEKVGPMKVEMHASLVYTHPIFADFQNEVKHAICSMGVGGLTTVGAVEYHDVRDGLKHRSFRVEFNTKTNESKCACKLFERHGIVCWHILWVWNGRQVIEDIDEADIKKAEMSKVWSEIYETVRVMDSYATVKQMKQLQKTLTQFRENITGPIEPKTKNKEIEALLGITASNDIDLRPPNKAKNKGSGKRLRSSKEKAKSKPQKRKRRCEKTLHLLCKRQLKEKKNRNYHRPTWTINSFFGVNALRKYYTEVDISISGDWTPVLKAMELMEAYKNPFRDESVEVENLCPRTGARRRENRIKI